MVSFKRSSSSSTSSSSSSSSTPASPPSMMAPRMFLLDFLILCFISFIVTGVGVHCEMLKNSFDDRLTHPRSGPLEICQWSGLNASCPVGSVIMVETALYGRMRLSKCIDKNYGYIGCSVEVKEYLEHRCAGRGQCHVTLPDEFLDRQIRPCPSDLKSYLEISYYCLTVQYKPDEKSCSSPIELKLTSGDVASGLLSNHVTGETNQGSTKCPWVLRGQPGVKFKFTLFDFALVDGGPAKSGVCSIYAQIKETLSVPTSLSAPPSSSQIHQPNTMICGGENRHHVVYTSESHVIRIELTNPMTSSRASYFLLKYETFDCPEAIVPHGAVILEKKADRLTLYCKGEGLKSPAATTWELRCEGNRWVGREGNCTTSDQGSGTWRFTGNIFGGQNSLTRNVIGGFIALTAIMVAIAILLVGIWSITRSRRKSRETRRQQELREKVLSGSSGAILDALMHDVNNHRHQLHQQQHQQQQQQQQQQLGEYTGVNSMLADKNYRYNNKDKEDGDPRPILTTAVPTSVSQMMKFPPRGVLAKLQSYPESYPIPPPPIGRPFRGQHFPSPQGQLGSLMDIQSSTKEGQGGLSLLGQDVCYDDACGRMAVVDASQNFGRQYMDVNQQQQQSILPKQQQQQQQQILYEDHIYESPKFLRKASNDRSESCVP